MGPIFDLLGLSVGVVQANASPATRHRAYRCDVTYTTAKEIGFDFLRDRLAFRRQASDGSSVLASMLGQDDLVNEIQTVQREFQFLLLDEADNILIDEARTPLIVSAMPNRAAKRESLLYQWAAQHSAEFTEGAHFEIDPTTRLPMLNGQGRRRAHEIPLPELASETPLPDLYDYLARRQSMLAIIMFAIATTYYATEKFVIVDEFTGRLAEGRQWRTGLHQAIEAREGLEISVATGEAARVTVQDLCLQFPRLCGMTGTVANSGRELLKIYQLRSINVPTNRPACRDKLSELVYGTESDKWTAIVDEVKTVRDTGRPVLVGTRSIDKSERLSALLKVAGVPHVVLNAHQLAHEAEIISHAGRGGHAGRRGHRGRSRAGWRRWGGRSPGPGGWLRESGAGRSARRRV